MPKPTADDYLQQGIHGPKETNPEERRKFLGTIRERIVIALYQGQVMEPTVYSEVEQSIKEHRETKLLLNGHIAYEHLSKYIKLANTYKIPYTMETNKQHNSDIGLVLAYPDKAIEKEDIFVEKKVSYEDLNEKKEKPSFFQKLFRFPK